MKRESMIVGANGGGGGEGQQQRKKGKREIVWKKCRKVGKRTDV